MKYTYRKIWLINLPVMMSILVEQLINITDALFLGHVGQTELGASALGGIWFLAVYMIGFGFSLGMQSVIARNNGAGNRDAAANAFVQGAILLAAMAAACIALSKLVSPPLLKAIVKSDAIYGAVTTYLDWRLWGIAFSFPFLAIRAFLVGITVTRPLTAAAMIALAVNIAGNTLLIFGLDMGIAGAAIASSLAEMSALLFLLWRMSVLPRDVRRTIRLRFDPASLRTVTDVSRWSMVHSSIGIMPWFLFFLAIEHTGERNLAVANILRSVSTLFFVLVNSFATTAGSLAGNLSGEGRNRDIIPLCRRTASMGYAIGMPLVAAVLLLHRTVVGCYTADEGLILLSRIPYAVMLANYLFALPSYVATNAVIGTGAARTAFRFQLTTIAFYLAYLWLLHRAEASLSLFWTAEYLYVILLLIQSGLYLRRRCG